MAGSSEELAGALEQAATGTEESGSTTDKEAKVSSEVQPKETDTKTPSQQVPYTRFKEVVDQKNDLSSSIEELSEKLAERDQEIGKLVDLLQARENDSKIVEKINELHANDPRYSNMIETLDKALQGIHEEVESGKTTPEQAEVKAAELIRDTREDIADALADERSERILDRADVYIERFFDALPDQYADEDKDILSDALVDKIDWEAVEENPDALIDVLSEGFQNTLNWYGEPKGALRAAKPSGDGETDTPKASEPTVEEIAGRDWGKLVTAEDSKGRKYLKPELSEEDFTSSLAEVIRRGR